MGPHLGGSSMNPEALKKRTGISALALLELLIGTIAQTVPADATAAGLNGRIAFGRFNDGLGDFQLFTANPDGSHEVQVLPTAAECPTWSPDGNVLLICVSNADGLLRPARVTPEGSSLTLLDN